MVYLVKEHKQAPSNHGTDSRHFSRRIRQILEGSFNERQQLSVLVQTYNRLFGCR